MDADNDECSGLWFGVIGIGLMVLIENHDLQAALAAKLPSDLDSRKYETVVIWRRAFSVLFSRAPLERT